MFKKKSFPKSKYPHSKDLNLNEINLKTKFYEQNKIYFDGEYFYIFEEKVNKANLNEKLISRLPKLYQYELHYLKHLISSVKANKHENFILWKKLFPISNDVAWDPYVVSMRLINIIKWILNENIKVNESDRRYIYDHALFIRSNLEYHILGNHLLLNAKALIFSGIFFQTSEAEEWLEKGINLYRKELKTQFTKSGMHFELSPMYHLLMVQDILDILNIKNISKTNLCDELSSLVKKSLVQGIKTCHPDGDVSMFNDSCLNQVLSIIKLREYFFNIFNKDIELDENTQSYDQDFFSYNLRNAKLIFNVAENGPSFIPAHCHADTLSFELSLFQERFIVNSGISTYENIPLRLFQKSTRAKSTLCIGHQNSSKVFGAFRMSRGAKILNRDFLIEKKFCSI